MTDAECLVLTVPRQCGSVRWDTTFDAEFVALSHL
jgi:hypothetical protein